MISISSLHFDLLKFNSRKQVLFGVDSTGTYFLKIQIIRNPNKTNDIAEEYQIMKHLNDKGCVTCPRVFEYGTVNRDYVYKLCDEKTVLDQIRGNDFGYIMEQFVSSKGGYNLSDVMFTLLEQQSLGVYHADIKPDNIRFCDHICYFIDYDQSLLLDQETSFYNTKDFMDFCSSHYSKKYCNGSPNHFLSRITGNGDMNGLFVNGALDLGNTSVFKSQRTTNTPNGIYQNICSKNLYANGPRTVDQRIKILNEEVSFIGGERVLDVGCNLGMLSCYLSDRGCCVTGIDNDASIIRAAKMVSNIFGRNIDYKCVDLDAAEKLEPYDTIVLFSVLHHTRNIKSNASKVVKSCNRILFETRLNETGKQFIDGSWKEVNKWSFGSVNSLVGYLEEMFDGFKLNKVLGMSEKDRHVLEFHKKGGE